MAEERLPHGTFRRERQILMRMEERRQRGAFLPGHRIHTQVGAEAEAEADGIVREVEVVGVATTGEARHLEGRTTPLMTGRRTLG